jgi:hypothetical protein
LRPQRNDLCIKIHSFTSQNNLIMAKFKFFGLFFLLFHLSSTQLNILLARPVQAGTLQDQCNLPAPDSFRITQVGGDFISLAWNPIFPGANHQLVVLESDGMGGWVTILIENQVSGDTYRADNLEPGISYRFVVATKCANGDPSEIKAIIDGITLILDLVIDGRKPVNPIYVGSCQYIPKGFDWIGFSVLTIDGDSPIENYFELLPKGIETSNSNSSKKFELKRFAIDHPIVASNELGMWPNCDEPQIKAWNGIVRIDKLIGGGIGREIVGYVDIAEMIFPSGYYICPDYDHPDFPWKSNYQFKPMVSFKTAPPQNCGERNLVEHSKVDIMQQTIFSNNIQINLESHIDELNQVSVRVYNETGQIFFNTLIDYGMQVLNVDAANWPSGSYVVNIKSRLHSDNYLVFKIK